MDVLLNQFQFTSKSGLALTKNNVKFSRMSILKQSIELGPVSISAGIIIVTIDAVYFPSLIYCVCDEHTFLVLDGCTVVSC